MYHSGIGFYSRFVATVMPFSEHIAVLRNMREFSARYNSESEDRKGNEGKSESLKGLPKSVATFIDYDIVSSRACRHVSFRKRMNDQPLGNQKSAVDDPV